MATPKTSDNTRSPKLDDDEIIQIITYGIGQSVGFSESKLSKERTKVQWWYDCERPLQMHEGDSDFISTDIYDAVESMKAQLLDVFVSNARPVKFKPNDADDVEEAKARTEYVTNAIFKQNPGYNIFRDVIEEALKSRNAVVKAWWDEKYETRHVTLNDVNEDIVAAWIAENKGAKIVEKEEVDGANDDPDIEGAPKALKRVKIAYQKDVSQVKLYLLAPEEFGISPMATSLKTADLVFQYKEMTVSELLKEGYDPSIVEDLQNNDRLWMAQQPEKIARFWATDDLIGTKVNEDGQNSQRVCGVYECYVPLDMKGDDQSELWKVVMCGDTILDKEPVDRHPFVDFCPLPRPSAFWGFNFAKLLIPTQKAKTFLTRSIVNHAMITNNPRYLVQKGTLANPRELMENRFGGLVNAKSVNGVVPLPQAGLNPFVFQTIQLLDSAKEQTTSMSSLQQGLNKDAISKQNSADMVHELISVAQLRQKIIARNFAEGFLAPLYTLVYLLVLENEAPDKIMQVAGNWTPVDPKSWPEDVECEVAFTLGYGEALKEAQQLAGIGAALAQDPALTQWFTPQEHHYLAQQAVEASGRKDVNNILRPFSMPVQPPPNPMQQAELAMKQADAAAKNAQAQATIAQIEFNKLELASKHTIEMQKLDIERAKVGVAHHQANADMTAAMNQPGPDPTPTTSGGMNELDIKLQVEMEKLRLEQDKLAHAVSVDAAELAMQEAASQRDALTASVTGSANAGL